MNSNELRMRMNKEIEQFKELLKASDANKISLEFYTKKKRSWPLNFQFENIPWEIWTIKIDLMQLSNENGIALFFTILNLMSAIDSIFDFIIIKERQVLREKLSDLLGEKVRQIIEIMDKPDYTPKMQNYNELDTIYEPDFKDIQPYLYRVRPTGPSTICFHPST